MADVYAAFRHDLDGPRERYALKLLQKKWSLDPQLRAMFHSEARLTTALDHENLVRVYEAGEHLGVPFMVMEYVDGVSCARILRAVSSKGECFPATIAIEICLRVLDGLTHAHEATDRKGRSLGIVHRDVSPGNILLSRKGDVKLADFGIARSTQVEHHTDPGQVKGKFGYMSPEQVVGDQALDGRSDLFSLGVVLAEMLMGKRLFAGSGEFEMLTRMYEADVRMLDDESVGIDPALLPIVKRALEQDRRKRFQSASEFRVALEGARQQLGFADDEPSLVSWLLTLGLVPSQSGTYALKLDPTPAAAKDRAT